MRNAVSLVVLLCCAASCAHEEEAQLAYPGTQVTVVQQTTVQQTVPVHVHYGRGIDCEMLCRNVARSCEQACVPTSWSPNMSSIQGACEGDCRFGRFVCVNDCRRSGS